MAGAIDGFFGADDALFKGGHGHDHLVGRSGRVGALHGLVDQRAVFRLQQRVIIGRGYPPDEQVRVVAGRRGIGDQIAVLAIHDHDGGAFATQTGLHKVLQLGIDGKLQIRPRLPFAAGQFAHHTAGGVDLDLFGAGRAAQQGFLSGLDVDLADLETGDAQHRIGVFQRVQIGLAHAAHTADNMRKVRPAGIDTGQADLGADTGQGGGVDRHAADLVPCDIIGDGHRQERGGAFDFGHRAVAHFGIKVDDLTQPVHHRIHIIGILAYDHDPVRRHVLRQPHAVAVKDFASCRRDQPDVDPVLFGEQAELVSLIDLQVIHPRGQTAHEQQLRAAQQNSAAAELGVAGFAIGPAASHLGLLMSGCPYCPDRRGRICAHPSAHGSQTPQPDRSGS